MTTGVLMNYLDDNSNYDEVDVEETSRKRGKRHWRDIENLKERRRVSKEIVRDDDKYFDLLEQPLEYEKSHELGL